MENSPRNSEEAESDLYFTAALSEVCANVRLCTCVNLRTRALLMISMLQMHFPLSELNFSSLRESHLCRAEAAG